VKAETADGMSSTTWLVANKSCFNLSETWHHEDKANLMDSTGSMQLTIYYIDSLLHNFVAGKVDFFWWYLRTCATEKIGRFLLVLVQVGLPQDVTEMMEMSLRKPDVSRSSIASTVGQNEIPPC
jgi:hypothetical protein